MANVRDLKKDVNYVLGDIIEAVYVWEKENGGSTKESEAIIDEAISTFDDLISKVNQKGIEDRKAHYRSIDNELEQKAQELVVKVNKL